MRKAGKDLQINYHSNEIDWGAEKQYNKNINQKTNKH